MHKQKYIDRAQEMLALLHKMKTENARKRKHRNEECVHAGGGVTNGSSFVITSNIATNHTIQVKKQQQAINALSIEFFLRN